MSRAKPFRVGHLIFLALALIILVAAVQSARQPSLVLIGVGFLVPCGWAYFARPSIHTRALAVMGLGLGLAFIGLPAIGSATGRVVAELARNGLVLAGMGAGLYFLRLMAARWGARAWQPAAIFAPLAVYWLMLAVLTIAPEETPRLIRAFIVTLGGLMFAVYGTLAMVTLLRAWIRNPKDFRVRMVALVFIIALLPVGLVTVLPILAPSVPLPALEFRYLPLIIIPFSWAWVAVTYKD